MLNPKIAQRKWQILYGTKLLTLLHFPTPPTSLSVNMVGGVWGGGNRYGIGPLGDYLAIPDAVGIDR